MSYRRTILACYTGNFVQAVILNVTPILFVPLMSQYGLTFEQMGRLVLINFITQFTVDMLCGRPVDRWGIRPFIVGGHLCAGFGLLMFAASPFLFGSHVYAGLLLGTVLFSAGGGLLELLLNPVISGIPGEEKARVLSFMHSFYAWGHIVVVLVTTLLVFLLGAKLWFVIPVVWSIFPILNAVNFSRVPLAPAVEEHRRTRLKTLLSRRFFLVCMAAMLLNGAIEVTMGQWASSFLETAAGLPKVVGDVAGVCMFACMMGVGRAIYGKLGAKFNLYRAMLAGSVLCAACYAAAALSGNPVVSVLACALCGLGVSVMWPGCVTIAAETYPLAGATMFALVSGAGDAGSSIGPWMVGFVADRASNGLRLGLLIAVLFPLGMFFCVRYLKRHAGVESEMHGAPAGQREA
ncbi:MFS transporter [Intestinibacillus massiliensis]|nr:MFS transporter [Intestinibacillus massiliensis]